MVEIEHLRRPVGEPLVTAEGDDLNDAARLSMRICHDRFHLHPEKAFATFEDRYKAGLALQGAGWRFQLANEARAHREDLRSAAWGTGEVPA